MRKKLSRVKPAFYIVAVLLLFVKVGYGMDKETDEFMLEEVTVTAQKHGSENVQKVANDIQVVTGEEMLINGVTNLSQALSQMSNVIVEKGATGLNVVIRGMTNNVAPGNSVSQVGISVDGTYSNNYGAGENGFYDMQRVEVLAGPQGTLYSRNSSGGIVNIISNDPKSEFDGSASIEIGSYNLLNTQGMVNVPLNNDFAFRAAFNTTSRDGYVSNGTDDDDTKSVRFKLGYNPSDSFSSVLIYQFTNSGGKGKATGVDLFEEDSDVDDPWTNSSIPENVISRDILTRRVSMNINWNTAIGNITFIPTFAEYSDKNVDFKELQSDHVTLGYGSAYNDQEQEEHSFELRMSSTDDFFFKWLVGIYCYEQDWYNSNDFYELTYEGVDFESSSQWTDRTNESTSVFGNVTYPINEALRLTFGGRHTTHDEENDGSNQDIEKYDSSNFDYKVAVEYDLSKKLMLWADYSTGYKIGLRGNPPEKLKAYQIGEKSRFFEDRLQINTTAYYYDYKDLQLEGGRKTVDNVEYMGTGTAMAELYGVDFTTEYVFSKNDILNFSISYLHADIESATIIYSTRGGASLPAEILTTDLPSLNHAPEWTISASYEHTWDLRNGSTFAASIDPRYQTESTIQFQPNYSTIPDGMTAEEVNKEPGHLMADFYLNYSDASGKWNINGYIKNITNHAEKTGYVNRFLQINYPRTYGAVFSVRF